MTAGGWLLGKYNTFSLHLPMSIDVAMVAAGFVILGYMAKDFMDRVKISVPLLLAAGAGVLAANWIGQKNGWAVMALHMYGNHFLLFIAGAILMNACILVLCKAVCQYMPCLKKALGYIGKHSLVFFAFQLVAFTFTEAILTKLGVNPFDPEHVYGILDITRDTIISLTVTVPWSMLISRFAPNLEGK